jgi:hypothetical protein
MEWFVLLAPVPNGALEFSVGAVGVILALLVAVVPVLLVLRHALDAEEVTLEAPQLRVIDGLKDLWGHAA